MSINEDSAETTQYLEEPTASATKANSAEPLRQQRPDMVKRFAAWAWLIAGVALIILVIAAIFFAGFFVGKHYAGWPSENYYVVPGGGGCIQTQCQPAGRYGQHCYQYRVPCPAG